MLDPDEADRVRARGDFQPTFEFGREGPFLWTILVGTCSLESGKNEANLIENKLATQIFRPLNSNKNDKKQNLTHKLKFLNFT